MALEMVREGVITPEMSCKDIQRAVKTLTTETDETETETPAPDSDSETPRTRKRNLSKIATADLIAELETRGYTVYENRSGVLTPVGTPETMQSSDPITVPGGEKGGE